MTMAKPTNSSASMRRRILYASVIGNIVEWYDWGIYGTMAAILAPQFFPNQNPTAALIATYFGFIVSYAIRPVGALWLGRLADIWGRKSALSISILIMSLGTVFIGAIPTYASIGLAAPILLMLFRLIQGVGASGEYTTANIYLIEHNDKGRRNHYSAITGGSVFVGLALGVGLAELITVILPSGSLESWGWRVLFLLSAPLAIVGFYIRRKLVESPDFVAATQPVANGDVTERRGRQIQPTTELRDPLIRGLRSEWATMLRLTLVSASERVLTFALFAYITTGLLTSGISPNRAFLVTLLTYAGYVVLTIAYGGRLADRIGERRTYLGGSVFFIIASIPVFVFSSSGNLGLAIVGLVLFVVGLSLYAPALSTVRAMSFPADVRGSASAVSYNVMTALLGSTAPAVATWLQSWSGSGLVFGYYIVALSVIALIAGIWWPPKIGDDNSSRSVRVGSDSAHA